MAIDPNVLDHMALAGLQNVNYDAGIVRMINANLAQAGGIVLTTVTQQAASVTDDAALNAAQKGAALTPYAVGPVKTGD